MHQKIIGALLGGATQALISWWESGRYLPFPRYLLRVNEFLSLDPVAIRVYAARIGFQARRARKAKPSGEVLESNRHLERVSLY